MFIKGKRMDKETKLNIKQDVCKETLEQEGRQYRTLEDGEELVISCDDCGDELLYIKTVVPNDDSKRWKVKCGCGGETFWIKYNGEVFISPAIGKNMINVLTETNLKNESLDTIVEIQ